MIRRQKGSVDVAVEKMDFVFGNSLYPQDRNARQSKSACKSLNNLDLQMCVLTCPQAWAEHMHAANTEASLVRAYAEECCGNRCFSKGPTEQH